MHCFTSAAYICSNGCNTVSCVVKHCRLSEPCLSVTVEGGEMCLSVKVECECVGLNSLLSGLSSWPCPHYFEKKKNVSNNVTAVILKQIQTHKSFKRMLIYSIAKHNMHIFKGRYLFQAEKNILKQWLDSEKSDVGYISAFGNGVFWVFVFVFWCCLKKYNNQNQLSSLHLIFHWLAVT